MSNDNVIHIAEIKNDNRLITPVQVLQSVEREMADGKVEANKLMVITLNTLDDKGGELAYDFKWFTSNMKSSEMIALLEIMKAEMLAYVLKDVKNG